MLVLSVLVVGLASALLGSAEAPPRGDAYPASAESAVVAEQLEGFPGSDTAPVLLVATTGDDARLTSADERALGKLAADLGAGRAHPQVSEDGMAATVTVPVEVSEDSATQVATIEDLRAEVADHAPAELDVQVTGGPAFGADIASAFDGADFTLLAVTLGVIALLLLLTYRSPVLWLVPLTVVGIADQVAGRVTAVVGEASGLPFDAGIVSVLVFGAGANYALLLISRYREELHEHDDHRVALRAAWRETCRRSSRAMRPSCSPWRPSSSPPSRAPAASAWPPPSASSSPSPRSSSCCPQHSRSSADGSSGPSSPAPTTTSRTRASGPASPAASCAGLRSSSPAVSPSSACSPPVCSAPGSG